MIAKLTNLDEILELEKLIETTFTLPSNIERREPLNKHMGKLIEEGKDCFSCSGMCCTYEFNSMQATPLETLELILFLNSQGRLDGSLFHDLKENIKSFRLDKEVFFGNGKELRRYYTCPFYLGKSKGCSISRHSKPYGCLGFNAFEKSVSKEGSCKSYVDVLESREQCFSTYEKEVNHFLTEKLGLSWNKKNISSAILDFLKFDKN